ncbi:hypothetical protein NP233_g1566 [Leucocoprinus birnbaumii]|uniref:Protein kinase domain-containing protein n=1 Tax=Leucocoprinus birnbaumii TaxID=56174 RepID=A0AAD5VZR2_9AGAR|nr:hypothetical protein NP233_g1566 [Leucocoprinus birnbaumii]
MDPPSPQDVALSEPSVNAPSESEVFATLYHLVSRLDAESRIEEMVEKARELSADDTQLLVNCLSMALDKDAAPAKSRVHIWRSLIRVVSSAKIFAQDHTLSSSHIAPENDPSSSDVYQISGDTRVCLKVVKHLKDIDNAPYLKSLISWAHLSHPNISPLYALFRPGDDNPYVVSPCETSLGICDYIEEHPEALRMRLIADVSNGLTYIHQLGIVHGGINPENVIVQGNGQALITNLDIAFRTNACDASPIRYSPPELLNGDENILPAQVVDVWSFACLCYEVLSENEPFFQIPREGRVAAAILKGNKPARPGREGFSGREIDDAIWQLLLMCWEFEPGNRPSCMKTHQVIHDEAGQDIRQSTGLVASPVIMTGSNINTQLAKDRLATVLGTHQSASLHVPAHLRVLLSGFLSNVTKFNATVSATKSFSPDDLQMFVDFLDLLLNDLPNLHEDPILICLSSIIVSTHTIPRWYKLDDVQYDPTPVVERDGVKIYNSDIPWVQKSQLSVVTRTRSFKKLLSFLPDWAHFSHPNLIPFFGVFQVSDSLEALRLGVVLPIFQNGFLEDFALKLPQRSRIPLIFDVIDATDYLHKRTIAFRYTQKDKIMVSDQGRPVIILPDRDFRRELDDSPSDRETRFEPPDVDLVMLEDQIWTVGCLFYTVLCGRLPYYQYEEEEEVISAVHRGEPLRRPIRGDDNVEEIDDDLWEIIMGCCRFEAADRLRASEIRELFVKWGEEHHVPLTNSGLPEFHSLTRMTSPAQDVDFRRVESLLGKIQVELLRSPLSKLLQNPIKDVTKAVTELKPEDVRTLVDFLDLALKERLTISEEQNRVLALLSRISSTKRIFPQRYELRGIKYDPKPMAAGGYGQVHRGTEIDVCVKITARLNPDALAPWIRELIVWAHSSHPNILPFYGVLLEGDSESPQICLVSPFMKNGNLHDYAPRLAQKSRLLLISDVINGLLFLHALGIIHGDLKGENVLISNEGRCLITDFGTTQVVTATVTASASLVPTTLRFAAPEVVLTTGPPTKERDIWSFGCLCYEVLSRLLPYYQYAQIIQVSAALARKEPPKRPSVTSNDAPDDSDSNEWDDFDEDDWDELDDQAWNLITRCCVPEPEGRLKAAAIQELIVDMKIYDDRPAARAVTDTDFSKLGSRPDIDMNRVGKLLRTIQRAVIPTDVEEEEIDVINLELVKPAEDFPVPFGTMKSGSTGASSEKGFSVTVAMLANRGTAGEGPGELSEPGRGPGTGRNELGGGSAKTRSRVGCDRVVPFWSALVTALSMDLPSPQDTASSDPGANPPSESEVFATLYHLVSRLDAESRVEEMVEKAQELSADDIQLLVNCLSMALDKNAAPAKSRVHIWRSLIRVVSSTKIFAQAHTVSSNHIFPENDPSSSDVYQFSGDTRVRLRVVKHLRDNDNAPYLKSLISWAHLSHPNILPLYALFRLGDDNPYVVSPCETTQGICDYIQEYPEALRMPLIADVSSGLTYIHQLSIVHGGINPENVIVQGNGQALITNLELAFRTNACDASPIRYSPPELLTGDDSIIPAQAVDMWSFACLCYEVLSENEPFFQIPREGRVVIAILKGSKPVRPGREGFNGKEIDDAMWQLLLMCWEFEPGDRPSSVKVHQVVHDEAGQDTRQSAEPVASPVVLNRSNINPQLVRDRLATVLGTHHPASLHVPAHLRVLLSGFLSNTTRFNATVSATKSFSPDDIQMFVDFLDLLLNDLPNLHEDPIVICLSGIIVSSHTIPRWYKLDDFQYDPTPVVERDGVKIYSSNVPGAQKLQLSVVTHTRSFKKFLAFLPDWAHLSHPNLMPFLGVFPVSNSLEALRLGVVFPFFRNGFLEDFASKLPQRCRIPLIFEVIDGIEYLHSRMLGFDYTYKDKIMVSDQGRPVLMLSVREFRRELDDSPPDRVVRFQPPGCDRDILGDQTWMFGCLCYKVLSGRLPYYQYEEEEEIISAVHRGEPLKRPNREDDDVEEIDDDLWEIIMGCCQFERVYRLPASEIRELFVKWGEEHDVPLTISVMSEFHNLPRMTCPTQNVDFRHVESLLGKIQIELLRSPLSKLLQNPIKDVTKAVAELMPEDVRILVDFLDLALKERLTISEEQNRVLALLSRISSTERIFPQRYELRGIKYDPKPMAAGGYGQVHRGTEIDVCVKITAKLNPDALAPWIRELIVWAHSSHPNILPFYGVLLEGDTEFQRICLVSPFMKNGNLHDYAPRLAQKSRLLLISDVINGLLYLHVLGIIHGDLKGENVLISNDGRCFITDFGTTQVVTATVTASASLVPTTLRFAAPEVVLTTGPPTKERDIWSFGCLCYEVLSRLLPYYQYAQIVQVSAALARKEPPKRPSVTSHDAPDDSDSNEWDDFDEDDWDELDDQAWNLITRCCVPEPEGRLKAAAIQELIVDMKIYDDRPAARAVTDTDFSKLGSRPDIDMNRVGELLGNLQRAVIPTDVEEGQIDIFDLYSSLSMS